jgi:hypothetical protein
MSMLLSSPPGRYVGASSDSGMHAVVIAKNVTQMKEHKFSCLMMFLLPCSLVKLEAHFELRASKDVAIGVPTVTALGMSRYRLICLIRLNDAQITDRTDREAVGPDREPTRMALPQKGTLPQTRRAASNPCRLAGPLASSGGHAPEHAHEGVVPVEVVPVEVRELGVEPALDGAGPRLARARDGGPDAQGAVTEGPPLGVAGFVTAAPSPCRAATSLRGARWPSRRAGRLASGHLAHQIRPRCTVRAWSRPRSSASWRRISSDAALIRTNRHEDSSSTLTERTPGPTAAS